MFDRLFDFNMGVIHVFINELQERFYSEYAPLKCEFAVTQEEWPFERRLELEYKTLDPGEKWAKTGRAPGFILQAKSPPTGRKQR